MQEILFKNFVFNRGLNLTVRRGRRTDRFQPGDEVSLRNSGRSKETVGRIDDVMYVDFRDILARDIQFEHDRSCTTYDGLLKTMIEVYPGFKESELVTLIFFYTGDDV